jgi:hypothetical protein
MDIAGKPVTATPMEHADASSALTPGPAASDSPVFVYALGRVEPRFPSLSIEKEFTQVSGRATQEGLTDRQMLQAVLSDPTNRYLARHICWVFVVQGLETYLLTPRDPADVNLLVESVRSVPDPAGLDLVIGVRGPLSTPERCGLIIPIVAFDQLYSFDRETLLSAIPAPEGTPKKAQEQFRATAEELLDRILQLADNAGAADAHRAVNYLTVRYPAIYERTATAHAGNAALTAVEVLPSRLSGVRTVVDVIFSYTQRQTDVTEKYFVRVDVTEEFPFLVTKLAPYFDR